MHLLPDSDKIAERIGFTGYVTVRRFDLEGRPIDVCRAKNVITNVGLNWLRDALEDTSLDAGIRYMGWGTGATAAAATDTTLGSESGRKQVTSWSDGTTGVKNTVVYLSPDEANITIEEFGWFASSTATVTTDSGVMWARVLYPGGAHTKTNLESIQVEREDTFA